MKTLFLALVLFLSATAFTQQYATTDEGKRVKLNNDGTWEFVKEKTVDVVEGKAYAKSTAATALLKSQKNNFGLWYNPAKWKKSTDVDNESAEYQLSLKGEDGYCMFISERIEIDMESLKQAALTNAKEAAPDAVIEREENRIVNGQKVKLLQISGTASGIKFVYLGYYTSNESGTIQLVCFTAKNLFKEYQKDFEDLLNGLTVFGD